MKAWKKVAIGMTLGMLVAGIPVLVYADDAIVEEDILIVAEDDIETVSDLGTDEGDIEAVLDLGADEDVFDDSMVAAEDESVTDISGLITDIDVLQAAAGDVIESGAFGNMSYTLDSEGKLTISGTGEIPDFVYEVDEEEEEEEQTVSPFKGRNDIESIVFSNGVTRIGAYMFPLCSNLKSITFPESLTEIGYDAFDDCISLTSVTIPDSVTQIGNGTFADCSNLKSITMPSRVTAIGSFTFYGCSSLESIIIPDGVELIGPLAFSGCRSLKNITIPDGMTSIWEEAFSGCSLLESITIPDSVTIIQENVFKNCPNLTIKGNHGSDAEQYANNNNIPFEVIPVVVPAPTPTPTPTPTITQPTAPAEQITISKKPTSKKLSVSKNKITVNWKHFKQNKKTKALWKKVKKVQIQCATDSAFTNIVKNTMVGKKKTKATIKGLSKKTTYYVRVRYYDGTGYSAWSKVKKVKTK